MKICFNIFFKGFYNFSICNSTFPTSDAEEIEVQQFYEDLQDLLELTPKKDVLFIIGQEEIRD